MMKIIITIPDCVIICMHRVHIYLFGSHMNPQIKDISEDIDAFQKIKIKQVLLETNTFNIYHF